jgi:uncharacterized protein YecE (DUF72 family)
MPQFLVGTSGWNYSNWRGSFYPENLPAKKFLAFYAQRFRSAEVNYSFYHLPRVTTYENWFASVPDDFVFALKLSRFITHIKRLHDVKQPWSEFLNAARSLKQKLGPILLQFPPSFHANDENLRRVNDFLSYASKNGARIAMEFRHESCFGASMLSVLREYRAALVIAHSSRFPIPEAMATGPFVYFRFHGPREWCASSYSKSELTQWARSIRSFMKQGLDAYAYFNNDARGDAAPNARLLVEMVTRSKL